MLLLRNSSPGSSSRSGSESTMQDLFDDDDASVHTTSTQLEVEPQHRTIQLRKEVTPFETVQQVAALGNMVMTGSHDNPYEANDTVVKIKDILNFAGQDLRPMRTNGFDAIPMNELDNFQAHVNPDTFAKLKVLQSAHGEALTAFSQAENAFNEINDEIAQIVQEKKHELTLLIGLWLS